MLLAQPRGGSVAPGSKRLLRSLREEAALLRTLASERRGASRSCGSTLAMLRNLVSRSGSSATEAD